MQLGARLPAEVHEALVHVTAAREGSLRLQQHLLPLRMCGLPGRVRPRLEEQREQQCVEERHQRAGAEGELQRKQLPLADDPPLYQLAHAARAPQVHAHCGGGQRRVGRWWGGQGSGQLGGGSRGGVDGGGGGCGVGVGSALSVDGGGSAGVSVGKRQGEPPTSL